MKAVGRTRLVACAALLVGASLLSGSAHAAASDRKLTIYAVATTAQFMNHADDRVRGMSSNPFNVDTRDLVILTQGKEKGNGPFPGDDVLYSFKLYGAAKLAKTDGSAIFTCYYEFVKRATCDAYFQLKDGLLLASGPVAFNSTRFTLAVTGGTGRYLGARGEVVAAPAPKKAQRFDFVLG